MLEIHSFDQDLRVLLFDAIGIIEVSLRANFAHYLASKHGPDVHLREELSRNQDRWKQNHQKLAGQIKQSPQNRIRLESPIWEISEVISFGPLSMMYKNLKYESRKEIAGIYCLESMVLETWLHHLSQLRNLCSHHCRLWNRQFATIATQPRKVQEFAQRWNPNSGRIYNSLLIIGYLLGKQPLQSEWGLRIGKLLDKQPEGYPSKYLEFPSNWKHENITNWQS